MTLCGRERAPSVDATNWKHKRTACLNETVLPFAITSSQAFSSCQLQFFSNNAEFLGNPTLEREKHKLVSYCGTTLSPAPRRRTFYVNVATFGVLRSQLLANRPGNAKSHESQPQMPVIGVRPNMAVANHSHYSEIRA